MSSLVRYIWDNNFPFISNSLIWRYMSVERLVTMLENACLYFAAATQFADPFEGATAVVEHTPPADQRFLDEDWTERAFQELRRLTKINCWHCADYESDAMWKLYAGQGKGVAICSSPDRLNLALRSFRLAPGYGSETIWFGPVRYCDLTKVRLRTNMERRFFFKHQAFAWEREYRLAISLRIAEEFAVKVPDRGVEVSVNLEKLISYVLLGPELSDADRMTISKLVNHLGFGDRLKTSSLLWRPRYI